MRGRAAGQYRSRGPFGRAPPAPMTIDDIDDRVAIPRALARPRRRRRLRGCSGLLASSARRPRAAARLDRPGDPRVRARGDVRPARPRDRDDGLDRPGGAAAGDRGPLPPPPRARVGDARAWRGPAPRPATRSVYIADAPVRAPRADRRLRTTGPSRSAPRASTRWTGPGRSRPPSTCAGLADGGCRGGGVPGAPAAAAARRATGARRPNRLRRVRMRFGVFLAPFHEPGENPTLALERDLELIQLARRARLRRGLGRRAPQHRLGDHRLARALPRGGGRAHPPHPPRDGRGEPPLPPPPDGGRPHRAARPPHARAHQLRRRPRRPPHRRAHARHPRRRACAPGWPRRSTRSCACSPIPSPSRSRRDWFSLTDAVLQLRPYQDPYPPIAVTSMESPAGMVLAGRHGAGVLSLTVAKGPRGPIDLAAQWRVAEEEAERAGRTVTRAEWRLSLPVHVAETRREALDDARAGRGRLPARLRRGASPAGPARCPGRRDRIVDQMVEAGNWVVGTPDDAVAAIERLAGALGRLRRPDGAGPTSGPRRRRSAAATSCWRATSCPRFQGSLAGIERPTRSPGRAPTMTGEQRTAAVETAQRRLRATQRERRRLGLTSRPSDRTVPGHAGDPPVEPDPVAPRRPARHLPAGQQQPRRGRKPRGRAQRRRGRAAMPWRSARAVGDQRPSRRRRSVGNRWMRSRADRWEPASLVADTGTASAGSCPTASCMARAWASIVKACCAGCLPSPGHPAPQRQRPLPDRRRRARRPPAPRPPPRSATSRAEPAVAPARARRRARPRSAAATRIGASSTA